ncbi:MAG: HYR domain-containing protein, partial [Verrucomicrobia bacterium]|nr:HYR domain-containing protein [Verrucomicrobiota bacterium]
MIIGLVVLTCSAAVTAVAATDPNDPVVPCWRNQAGTTFQKWSFVASNNPAVPESFSSPGTPQAAFAVTSSGKGWITNKVASWGTNQGIWDLGKSGAITLTIPNNPSAPTAYKYVWVEVVQIIGPSPFYPNYATVSIPGATYVTGQRVATGNSGSFGMAWWVDQTVWRLPNSPSSETVTITADGTYGSAIDQVVVDTLSVDVCPPTSISQNTDAGQCTALVTIPLPVVDGCKIASVACTNTLNNTGIANPSTFPVGTTPVACTITDSSGNGSACSFTVTVQDHQAPTITCPTDLADVPTDLNQCYATGVALGT